MTVGEKIRKFRIDQGYTQKELAIMSGLSESAIRNYELGNRFPSSEQLEKIANSLKISPYAMSDPNFDTYVSVMHALFALEDQYGLHAYRDESGVPQLMFKDKGHDSLNMLDHIAVSYTHLLLPEQENSLRDRLLGFPVHLSLFQQSIRFLLPLESQ